MTVEQTGFFGTEEQVEENVCRLKGGGQVTWLHGDQVRRLGPNKALRLMGIDIPHGADGPTRLKAWRDTMAARCDMEIAEFRRWLDYEVNIYGNRGLALFIWEIA